MYESVYNRASAAALRTPANAPSPLVVKPSAPLVEDDDEVELLVLFVVLAQRLPLFDAARRIRGRPLVMVTSRLPEESVVRVSQDTASMMEVLADQPEDEVDTVTEVLDAEAPALLRTDTNGDLTMSRVLVLGEVTFICVV